MKEMSSEYQCFMDQNISKGAKGSLKV